MNQSISGAHIPFLSSVVEPLDPDHGQGKARCLRGEVGQVDVQDIALAQPFERLFLGMEIGSNEKRKRRIDSKIIVREEKRFKIQHSL